MGFFRFFILCVFLISCGPREDEKLAGLRGNNRNDVTLKAGEVRRVDKNGEKFESCKDRPTWDGVRLNQSLSDIFGRTDKLKIVLAGGNSCYQVGKTVEVQMRENGEWKGIGVFHKVEALELMNKSDFLNDNEKVKEVADGMTLSVADLKDYVSGLSDSQINLTYLKSTDGSGNSGNGNGGDNDDDDTDDGGNGSSLTEVRDFRSPESDGVQAGPNCTGQSWEKLNVFSGIQEKVREAIKNKTMKALVVMGEKNCLVIGGNAGLNYNGGTHPLSDEENVFKVVRVTLRDKSDFTRDIILAETVAAEMGLSTEDFLEYIDSMPRDRVHTTRMEWPQAGQ